MENEDKQPLAPQIKVIQQGKSMINVSVKLTLGEKVFELTLDEVDRLAKMLNKLCGLLVFNPTDLVQLSQKKPMKGQAPKQPMPNQTVPDVIGGTIPPDLQQNNPSQ